MPPVASTFSSVAGLILSLIGVLPGAIQAGESLVATIQALAGIGALTPEQSASLIAVTREAVKAESAATQKTPIWRPGIPTPNPNP